MSEENKTVELKEKELDKASGGKYEKGEPSHKIGEKFETNFLRKLSEYGVITEITGFDEGRGYQYEYSSYKRSNHNPTGSHSACDYEIDNGMSLMEGFRIIN